jgi:hypothetical protein
MPLGVGSNDGLGVTFLAHTALRWLVCDTAAYSLKFGGCNGQFASLTR